MRFGFVHIGTESARYQLMARSLESGVDHLASERPLAIAWSVSFAEAIALAAHKRNILLLAKVSIDAEVDLKQGETGYFLGARLNVTIPGLERKVATELVDEAEKLCPYSKATCGNVEAMITLI
jgi:lipoyl-dependent peroxiredoxin